MPDPANAMVKAKHWQSLLQWLSDNAHDPGLILAVSERQEEPFPSEIHLLGSMSGFRPTGQKDFEHRACAAIIMRVFCNHGLIDLKVGRTEDTALLRAVCYGNFEIAEMLLEHGAGHPPCVIPFFLLFMRELLFGTA